MGKTLFTTLRGLTGISLFLTGTFWDTAAVSEQSYNKITPGLAFAPGDGFFLSYDKDRSRYHFHRITLCPPDENGDYGDSMCRQYFEDSYYINPFNHNISLIDSVEISQEAINASPAGRGTEGKHIDITRTMRRGDTSVWQQYETIETDAGVNVRISYKGDGWDRKTKLEFTDKDGTFLLSEETSMFSLHTPTVLTDEDRPNQTALMLEARWCGASSCSGQVKFYIIERTGD